ncbi:MAG TPA: DUF502 domain-containing protein [Longimicrobiales bacterium]|nr:DUF502 domain-containing protein [Longimicrobiales bacterium]
MTGFVLYWIFLRVDGLLGRILYPAIGLRIPGLGLLTLLLLLLGIGWAAERAVGSRMIAWWHGALERIPVARRIYGAANSIVRTVLSKEDRPFNEVVLIEYPSPGRWSLGFLAAAAPSAARPDGEDMVTVFVPTTPNPTSGMLVMVPRSAVRVVAMTIDEAFTFVLSAGSVTRPLERPQ